MRDIIFLIALPLSDRRLILISFKRQLYIFHWYLVSFGSFQQNLLRLSVFAHS